MKRESHTSLFHFRVVLNPFFQHFLDLAFGHWYIPPKIYILILIYPNLFFVNSWEMCEFRTYFDMTNTCLPCIWFIQLILYFSFLYWRRKNYWVCSKTFFWGQGGCWGVLHTCIFSLICFLNILITKF